jgi:hypothetical protein
VSPCPYCDQKAAHVAVILPWTDGPNIVVVHRCTTEWCPNVGKTWEEKARDPKAAIMECLEWRQETRGLCFAEGHPGGNLEADRRG